MPFDYKKEYKEFYLPPKKPGIVRLPAMHFLAVRGQGDPNEEAGAYKQVQGVDYTRKGDFQWISLIRLPEFVTEEVFAWALRKAEEKKQQDFSPVEFFQWEEGLCVQCMHIGPYDDEPATVAAMREYAQSQGYAADFGESRFHHEIYLSDVRRCSPQRLKTVIRHPIKKLP